MSVTSAGVVTVDSGESTHRTAAVLVGGAETLARWSVEADTSKFMR